MKTFLNPFRNNRGAALIIVILIVSVLIPVALEQIGRASCRERV